MADLLKEENQEMRRLMTEVWELLKFMKSHGPIGPDSDGNQECSRCNTALKRAISKLKPQTRYKPRKTAKAR